MGWAGVHPPAEVKLSIQPFPISDTEAWAISRAFLGKPSQIGGMTLSPLVSRLLQSLDWNNPTSLALARTIFEPVMARILVYGPNDPPPPSSKDAAVVVVPALPLDTALTDEQKRLAATAGRWLTDWSDWATRRSPMTPPEFLEAGGVWLIGLAVARRACLHLHERIFPHLYMLWVATTTRYAKSTGLRTVRHTAMLAFPHLLMPEESTPEALLNNLAGEPPENLMKLEKPMQERIQKARLYAAQRGILIDEASSLLGAAKKDYMAGMVELLLKAYDGPEEESRSTRGGGMVVVKRLGLSILGATTPAAMARYVGFDRWEDGDMARYAILYPEFPTAYTDEYGNYDPPPELIQQIAKLHTMLPIPQENAVGEHQPAEVVNVTMANEARAAFRRYRKALIELSEDVDQRLHGNYGRLPTQALKVAMNLALIDWAGQATGSHPAIQPAHWWRAQSIVENWRASLHRALTALDETVETRAQRRIMLLLRQSPSGLYARDICRGTGLTIKHVEAALHLLMDAGMVDMHEQAPAGGGWTTKLYRWVGNSMY